MNILSELKARFETALSGLTSDAAPLLEMIRPAQDPKFGDYQANCAMPLKKELDRPSPEIAAEIVARLDVADMCHEPEIAGPGFINLRLKDAWLAEQLHLALHDVRLGVPRVESPRTFVIDYSSPNVAKPMHVGHIRSTVIGDALCRTLRFLGHRVISDNHLGDWGTQFGMIIYGYKNFCDPHAYERNPVAELGRLYKLVNKLVEYHQAKAAIPRLEQQAVQSEVRLDEQRAELADLDKAAQKQANKEIQRSERQLAEQLKSLEEQREKVTGVESDSQMALLARDHGRIADAVLEETAKLHADDEENLALWHRFLPHCRDEIQSVYRRLGVEFDYEYGESFYHDRLAAVVDDLAKKGLATESEGAICVFLEGYEAPMIVRKKDGAFLYATTDLATIQYRMETWSPDAILYVVDHRQGEHFGKLFAAVRLWGYDDVELEHIAFGTVLGKDGKPFRTRSGDVANLEDLLDQAVATALRVVSENDEAKPSPELSAEERSRIAGIVGHAAVKYADLSHNRTSDYKFELDKMVALQGNTATYMQYSYARTQSIFARGGVEIAALRESEVVVSINHPAERALALEVLRFQQALDDTATGYFPHNITGYLFELARRFSTFFEQCPVLKAETEKLRDSRLMLCDVTGRTIRQGLELLGIDVIDKM
ncbi:MAG: arginine--tRNA ligase [Pirellulaceae bacterium]